MPNNAHAHVEDLDRAADALGARVGPVLDGAPTYVVVFTLARILGTLVGMSPAANRRQQIAMIVDAIEFHADARDR